MKAKPAYLLHKAKGLAYTRIDGRQVYLGRHGSPESQERFDELLREWTLKNSAGLDRYRLQVSDLALFYDEHCQAYYRKNGDHTSEVACIRHAFRPLIDLHGKTRVRDFGPLALKAVREKMIADGYARGTINKHVGRIRRLFRWGVENEYVPAEVYSALMAVSGLRAGRSEAIETAPVKPVSQEDVDAVLAEVSPVVGAMIRFQLATGARSGEVVQLREGDIDRSGKVWIFTPASHKTEHRGKSRRIFIGPRAQMIIRPLLTGNTSDYVFRPGDVVPAVRKDGHASRKKVGLRYDRDAYRRCIERACIRASIPVWTPHQLRHSAATSIRREFGLEAAQAVLGHANAKVTEIYAERNDELAEGVIAKIG